MTRKIIVIAFLLATACNSLGAVLPYIGGDNACEAKCCRPVRRAESRMGVSRLRCLMQCEHPAENQGLPQTPLLRSERDQKFVAPVAPAIQTVCSTLNARSTHPTCRTALPSTHIYLKTGTLLI